MSDNDKKRIDNSYRAGLLLIPIAVVLPLIWMSMLFNKHGLHKEILYFGLGIMAFALLVLGLSIVLIKKFNK